MQGALAGCGWADCTFVKARNHKPMSFRATPLQTCDLYAAVIVANTCSANRPARLGT